MRLCSGCQVRQGGRETVANSEKWASKKSQFDTSPRASWFSFFFLGLSLPSSFVSLVSKLLASFSLWWMTEILEWFLSYSRLLYLGEGERESRSAACHSHFPTITHSASSVLPPSPIRNECKRNFFFFFIFRSLEAYSNDKWCGAKRLSSLSRFHTLHTLLNLNRNFGRSPETNEHSSNSFRTSFVHFL